MVIEHCPTQHWVRVKSANRYNPSIDIDIGEKRSGNMARAQGMLRCIRGQKNGRNANRRKVGGGERGESYVWHDHVG